jgi:hypothetical protein
MVRGRAGLHTNQAGPLFLEERQHLTPPQLAAENHTTRRVNAMDLINVLREIDTNRDNLCHRTAPISLWFMKTTILAPRCRRVGAVHGIISRLTKSQQFDR